MRLKTAIVGVIYRKVSVSLSVQQYCDCKYAVSVTVRMHHLSLNNNLGDSGMLIPNS